MGTHNPEPIRKCNDGGHDECNCGCLFVHRRTRPRWGKKYSVQTQYHGWYKMETEVIDERRKGKVRMYEEFPINGADTPVED
jgi:hypothetical protein